MTKRKVYDVFESHFGVLLIGAVFGVVVWILTLLTDSDKLLVLLSAVPFGTSGAILINLVQSFRNQYLDAREAGLHKGKSFAKHHVLRFLATMMPNTLGSLALTTVVFEWEYRWVALVVGVLGHLISLGVSYLYEYKLRPIVS